MKTFLIALFLIFGTMAASAQTLTVGVDYGRLSLKPNFQDPLQDVNSIRVNALARVAGPKKGDGFKVRAGFEFQRTFDKEVIPNYLGTDMDIYRDVNTYLVLGEVAYRKSIFEIAGRAGFGAEKPHEDFDYSHTRKYQIRGSIIKGNFGFTPFYIEWKKEPLGFQQGYGAGAFFTF